MKGWDGVGKTTEDDMDKAHGVIDKIYDRVEKEHPGLDAIALKQLDKDKRELKRLIEKYEKRANKEK